MKEETLQVAPLRVREKLWVVDPGPEPLEDTAVAASVGGGRGHGDASATKHKSATHRADRGATDGLVTDWLDDRPPTGVVDVNRRHPQGECGTFYGRGTPLEVGTAGTDETDRRETTNSLYRICAFIS